MYVFKICSSLLIFTQYVVLQEFLVCITFSVAVQVKQVVKLLVFVNGIRQ